MQWKQLWILGACLLMSCSSLDAGWRAQKAGNYDEAQKQAMIALAREPRNPDVYRLVATTALARGQYDSALKSALFARRLDGGTQKTEKLIRQISYQKKDWKTLCDAGLRIGVNSNEFEPDDKTRFSDGYAALKKSMTGEGYGCVVALEAQGIEVDGAEQVRLNHAMQLVRNGQYREALNIADSSENPDLNQLLASRSLFALNRKQEAVDRLQQYVDGANDVTREMRMAQAAAVCEEYRQYPAEAQILSGATSSDNGLKRIMALRRSYRQDEAESLMKSRLEAGHLSEVQVLSDMQVLCDAGYGDMALETYRACEDCSGHADTVFKAADMLMEARQSQAAIQMLSELGEGHASDGALQVRLFNWYRSKKYYAQALLCADRAHQAGIRDDVFDAARLETYVAAREYKTFEREAKTWIASHEAPAAEARESVAAIEAGRANWAGVIEVLKPVNEAHALKGNGLTLYINALSATHAYEALYETLSVYRPEMKPETKAGYFMVLDAEPQFRQSISPMLADSGMRKFEGEMLLARYLYEIKEDEQAGDKAIADALAAGSYSDTSYERAVTFYRGHWQYEKAMQSATEWEVKYPAETEPCYQIGEIYLIQHQFEDAGTAFEKCLNRESDKYIAIRKIYAALSKRGDGETGLQWVERVTAPYTASASGRDRAITMARAEVYYDLYSNEHNSEKKRKYRDSALAEYRFLLDGTGNSANDLLSYATALRSMGEASESYRAFAEAQRVLEKSNKSLSDDKRQDFVAVAALSGKSDGEIRQIAGKATSVEAFFALAELLEKYQRAEALDPDLEKYLGDKSIDTRLRAYHFLIRHALSNGDINQIEKYNKKLEASAPDNPDVRMEIVRTTLSVNLVDASVRHLTWLQMMRPDARDVLYAELTLERRMPEHAGVKSLVEATLDAAEGVYYRLDWIAQFYEGYGDYERALYYAEKAYTASTLKDNVFELRMLKLYLRTGKYEESETAAVLLDDVRTSVDWKPQLIVELAAVAQESGYYRQAQQWMNEAIAQAPDLPGLKVKKLEMALDGGDEGQVALGLEKAMEPPVADVSDALIARGQMRDIIQAIDLYEQNGERERALSALIRVLPAYLQTRGIVSTRRLLQDLSDFVPAYQSEAAEILSKGALLSDSPCTALAYVSEMDDPQIWARLLVRCPDARDNIMQSVRSHRSAMRLRARSEFDDRLYDTLVQMQRDEVAGDYADEVGMTDSALMKFKRRLASGSVLTALSGLAEEQVENQEHIEVIRDLAAYGYAAETIDYATENFDNIPAGDRENAAAIAVLLGSNAQVFEKYLSEGVQTDRISSDITGDTAARLYAASTLKKWMSNTASTDIASVFYIALLCAKQNPDQSQQIYKSIFDEIEKRNQKTTLLISASEHAVALGQDEFSLTALNRLKVMMPTSDYVYRLLSIVQARSGQLEQAWHSLQDGASYTILLNTYWAQAAQDHASSPLELRKRINASRLAVVPRQPALFVNETSLALESGDAQGASEFAGRAYQYGGDAISADIGAIYEAANASLAIPEVFYRGTSSQSLVTRARVDLSSGDPDTAMQHYIDAAQRAAWPIQVYGEGIETALSLKKWPQAEQLIAKMGADYPHAYMPYVYRSVYALAQNHPDEAWQSYTNARDIVFETHPWIEKIVYAGIQYKQPAFVKRLFDAENQVGGCNASAWLNVMLNGYLDQISVDSNNKKSAAQDAIAFIEQLMPAAAGIARNDDGIRRQFITLAALADRQDWLQRLGTTSF